MLFINTYNIYFSLYVTVAWIQENYVDLLDFGIECAEQAYKTEWIIVVQYIYTYQNKRMLDAN